MVVLENRVKEAKAEAVIKKGVAEVQSGNTFRFGAIYGMHAIQDRKLLWEDMGKTIAGITDPYVLMGDYNTILTNEDRVQGTLVHEFKVKDFKEFIWRNGITELKTVGRKYTWTNNHVHNKIDRILVNAAWIKIWPVMEGRVLQPGFFDHCPLSITMDYEQQSGERPFKFFNCMAQHKEFEDTVYEYWRKRGGGTIMNKVWIKLKILKNKLKQINRQEFSNTGQRIQATRIYLEGIQEQMDGSGNSIESITQEKEAKTELAKWIGIEESIMKKKSMIKWLKLGDVNTTYCHTCAKSRQATNHIGNLFNNACQLLNTAKDVEAEILKFYEQLLGTAAVQLPAVSSEVMK
ncbi:uncharacterized protein [Nicotiana sylvestris]|uniref:uncharacterized protein n=1 Tax=Nicotiana sylvestris TaxID=4096 RepID=UPI00388C5A3E